MTFRITLYIIFCSVLLQMACRLDSSEVVPELVTVSLVNSNKIKASDLFAFKGFVKLQNAGEQPLRSISKLLFADNSIIVLDAETDFQDIYRYESSTGNFLNKIGYQSEQGGGYQELYDIDFNAEKNRVVGLSTGNTSFMIYDFQGKMEKQLRNGVLGESFAILPEGGYVVYNEFTATKISGYNFLIFYDEKGNVLKRAMPYPDSMDNYGYNITGFLGRDGTDIVFSPPFCDTIYAIQNKKLVPLYVIDFLDKAIPKAMRFKKMKLGEIEAEVSYLNEGLVRTKNLALFHFMDYYRPTLGVYHEIQDTYWDATGFQKNDPFYVLIQQGAIFPKDDKQFVLVLEPKVVKNLSNDKLIEFGNLAESYPELANVLENCVDHPGYILLYFEAK